MTFNNLREDDKKVVNFDNIDWGHDPTKDKCSSCNHTVEMHWDNLKSALLEMKSK